MGRDTDWDDAQKLTAGIASGEIERKSNPDTGAEMYTPTEAEVQAMIDAQNNVSHDTVREYECEGCGKKEILTEKEAYESGWDYPPFMGQWGIVSPRTCGDCGIETTAYWQILHGKQTEEALGEKHWATVVRITEREP